MNDASDDKKAGTGASKPEKSFFQKAKEKFLSEGWSDKEVRPIREKPGSWKEVVRDNTGCEIGPDGKRNPFLSR